MSEEYSLLIERISASSGIEKSEIEKKVEERRAKLSGLISREGAAKIVASDLGIRIDNIQIKISEIVPGMRRINIIGKVVNIFPVRSFNKNGRSGKVSNFMIADETGSSKVVLWDVNHISLIEKNEIINGDTIQINNASIKDGEIHLSSFSEIKKSTNTIGNIKIDKSFSKKNIEELKENLNVSIRGIIVQVFQPRFFSICPNCKKKVSNNVDGFQCVEHGNVIPEERSLINFVIDDGTENVRVVLFSDAIEKLIQIEKLKNETSLQEFITDITGTEVTINGTVKRNAVFNNLEIVGNEITKVDPSLLAIELEKNN